MGPKQNACKSVFRNGRTLPSKAAYTQAWIALINETERSKAALSVGTKREA